MKKRLPHPRRRTTRLSPDRSLELSRDVVHREIDGEIVILDMKKGHYYGLASTGADVWRQFRKGKTMAEIGDWLSGHYRVSPSRARRDSLALARRLISKGLARLA